MDTRNPRAKYFRRLARAQELLESTRRENYSREQDYKRVVTLRENLVRQMEKMVRKFTE